MPTAAIWPWLAPASLRAVQSTEPQQASPRALCLLCQVSTGGTPTVCECQGKDSRPVQVWVAERGCLPVSACSLSKEQPAFTANAQLSASGPCLVSQCIGVGSEPSETSGPQQHVAAIHSMHSSVWDTASLPVASHNKHAVAALAADFYYNDMTPRSNVTSTDPGTSRRPHSAAATTHRVSTRPPEGS